MSTTTVLGTRRTSSTSARCRKSRGWFSRPRGFSRMRHRVRGSTRGFPRRSGESRRSRRSGVRDIHAFLAQHGIEYVQHEHPPVMTCEEEKVGVPESGAARTKNLFLRDRKGKRHLLLVTTCAK